MRLYYHKLLIFKFLKIRNNETKPQACLINLMLFPSQQLTECHEISNAGNESIQPRPTKINESELLHAHIIYFPPPNPRQRKPKAH